MLHYPFLCDDLHVDGVSHFLLIIGTKMIRFVKFSDSMSRLRESFWNPLFDENECEPVSCALCFLSGCGSSVLESPWSSEQSGPWGSVFAQRWAFHQPCSARPSFALAAVAHQIKNLVRARNLRILDVLGNLVDFLADGGFLSTHCLLDDLESLHLDCVDDVLNMRVRGLQGLFPRLINKHLNDLLNEWNDRSFKGLFHQTLLNPVNAVHRMVPKGLKCLLHSRNAPLNVGFDFGKNRRYF